MLDNILTYEEEGRGNRNGLLQMSSEKIMDGRFAQRHSFKDHGNKNKLMFTIRKKNS